MNLLILSILVVLAGSYTLAKEENRSELNPSFYNPYRFKREPSVGQKAKVRVASHLVSDSQQKDRSVREAEPDTQRREAVHDDQKVESEVQRSPLGDVIFKRKRGSGSRNSHARKTGARKGSGPGDLTTFLNKFYSFVRNILKNILAMLPDIKD